MAVSISSIISDLTSISDYMESHFANAVNDRLQEYIIDLGHQGQLLENSTYNLLRTVDSTLEDMKRSQDDNGRDMIDVIRNILTALTQNLGSIDDTINDLTTVIETTQSQCADILSSAIKDAGSEIREGFEPIGAAIQSTIEASQEQFQESLEVIANNLNMQMDEFALAIDDMNANMLLEVITVSNMVQATIETTATELEAIVETESFVILDTVSSLTSMIETELQMNYDILSEYIETSDDRIERLMSKLDETFSKMLDFDMGNLENILGNFNSVIQNNVSSVMQGFSKGGTR